MTAVNFSSPKVKNPPLLILETLAERLNLQYDSGEARSNPVTPLTPVRAINHSSDFPVIT